MGSTCTFPVEVRMHCRLNTMCWQASWCESIVLFSPHARCVWSDAVVIGLLGLVETLAPPRILEFFISSSFHLLLNSALLGYAGHCGIVQCYPYHT